MDLSYIAGTAEKTLVLFQPSCVERSKLCKLLYNASHSLVYKITSRFN